MIFLAIAISGTLWVMFHMNTNMMPSHTDLPPVDQPAVAAPAPAAVQPAAEPAAAHSGHSSN